MKGPATLVVGLFAVTGAGAVLIYAFRFHLFRLYLFQLDRPPNISLNAAGSAKWSAQYRFGQQQRQFLKIKEALVKIKSCLPLRL
jgi:hypothetical protein